MSNRKQTSGKAAVMMRSSTQLSTVPPRLPLDLFQISEASVKNESCTINADSSVASTSSALEMNLTLLSASNNENKEPES